MKRTWDHRLTSHHGKYINHVHQSMQQHHSQVTTRSLYCNQNCEVEVVAAPKLSICLWFCYPPLWASTWQLLLRPYPHHKLTESLTHLPKPHWNKEKSASKWKPMTQWHPQFSEMCAFSNPVASGTSFIWNTRLNAFGFLRRRLCIVDPASQNAKVLLWMKCQLEMPRCEATKVAIAPIGLVGSQTFTAAWITPKDLMSKWKKEGLHSEDLQSRSKVETLWQQAPKPRHEPNLESFSHSVLYGRAGLIKLVVLVRCKHNSDGPKGPRPSFHKQKGQWICQGFICGDIRCFQWRPMAVKIVGQQAHR